MKRIEKEYTKVTKEVYFEAWDGEKFSDEAACKEYENNARGVVGNKAAKFMVARTNEYELFNCFGVGCEDYCVEVFKPTTNSEMDTLNQYMHFYYKNAIVLDYDLVGQNIIVTFNYDKDWCNAFTLDEMSEMLKENFKKRILKENEDEQSKS